MFLPSNITLQFGDSGDFVTELQRRLAVVKCFSEDMVNGFFDGNTVGGVTQFQVMVGLHADGVAGPETLRRLNGVIAGSGSASTEDKKEEEKSLSAQTTAMHVLYGQVDEQPNPTMWGVGTQTNEQTPPQAKAAEAAATPSTATSAPQQWQTQTQDTARDMARDNLQAQQAQAQMQQQFAVLSQAAPRVDIPAESQERLANEPTRDMAQEQPRGILGRITQFANAAIQRLAEYFEKKLPADTLKEVRAIGLTMAATGMKETAIAQGPDLPAPAPTPTRGPEQIQRV